MTRFITVFTSFSTFPLVLEKHSEICQADNHVCVDEVWCARWDMQFPERSHKKLFIWLFDHKIRLSLHEKLSLKSPNITRLIQSTSQTGSKNNSSLSINNHLYFFWIKVPWQRRRGAWLRYSISNIRSRDFGPHRTSTDTEYRIGSSLHTTTVQQQTLLADRDQHWWNNQHFYLCYTTAIIKYTS